MDLSSDKGADIALIKIFATMLNEVIDRLNQVPDKNFISFLKMIGVKLLPAHAARAPITFKLAEGTKQNVLIPERTQVAAGDVIFETEKNFVATPSKLVEMYCVDGENDAIYRSPENVISGKFVTPFKTKLLYGAIKDDNKIFVESSEGLAEGDTIIINKSVPALISKISQNIVILSNGLKEDYTEGSDVGKVTNFELFDGKNIQEHILYLAHNNLFNLKKGDGDNCLVSLKVYFKSDSHWNVDRNIIKEMKWEYWGKNCNTDEDGWLPFKIHKLIIRKETIQFELQKKCKQPTKEKEIEGIKSFWIRCIGTSDHTSLSLLENIQTAIISKNRPDMCFYNDIPINLNNNFFYPFGGIPKVYDTFYIASQECFSKKNNHVEITFTLEPPGTPETQTDLIISWEYWNGKGWEALKIEEQYLFKDSDKVVSFKVPPDIQLNEVNGQKNYWIKIKIVNGGYGAAIFEKIASDKEIEHISLKDVNPPKIVGINIEIKPSKTDLEHVFTYNDLEFNNITEESKSKNSESFKQFYSSNGDNQTVYFGFDQKLEKGPVSLFFSIDEYERTFDKIPIIKWECYAGEGKWNSFEVLDETISFTRSGVIEFVFPNNFEKISKFGKELYWIRAIYDRNVKPIMKIYAEYSSILLARVSAGNLSIAESIVNNYINPSLERYKPFEYKKDIISWKNYVQKWDVSSIGTSVMNKGDTTDIKVLDPLTRLFEENKSCSKLSKGISFQWPHPPEIKGNVSPVIKSIFINTAWAIQSETIKDELLGSSNGIEDFKLKIRRAPVIYEEIWINEIKTISETERKTLSENENFETNEVYVKNGNLTDFWVKWKPVEDIIESSGDDRHYEVDRFSGELKFGNGIHGKIPSIGANNIKANYRTGGGSKGNISTPEIKDLKSSIPYVDKAYNPIDAGGGSDVETIENAMEKRSNVLKHRNRAITAEDFEQIALQASGAISRVKCISNWDNNGNFMPGWVTVLIIPQTSEVKPKLSIQLKKQVEDYLMEHSTGTLQLQVSDPLYVETVVTTTLAASTMEVIPNVEKAALSRLKAFLNPITGFNDSNGWEFGKIPCLADFYALLEKIDGVNHVESISIELRTPDEENFVISPEMAVNFKMPSFAIVCNGEHSVSVKKAEGEINVAS